MVRCLVAAWAIISLTNSTGRTAVENAINFIRASTIISVQNGGDLTPYLLTALASLPRSGMRAHAGWAAKSRDDEKPCSWMAPNGAAVL